MNSLLCAGLHSTHQCRQQAASGSALTRFWQEARMEQVVEGNGTHGSPFRAGSHAPIQRSLNQERHSDRTYLLAGRICLQKDL